MWIIHNQSCVVGMLLNDPKLMAKYYILNEECYFDTELHLSFEEVLSAESIYEPMAIEKEN